MSYIRPNNLVADVSETRQQNLIRRTITLSSGDSIYYDIICSDDIPRIYVYDFVAFAVIFLCMRRGLNLHIAGPVTAQLLRNIEDLQEIWATWRPEKYKRISVTAEEFVEPGHNLERTGVFAFSGGVDGTAALLRHADSGLGLRRIVPRGALLVHGLDIPLDQTNAYETALASAMTMLAEVDVPLYAMATNWREFAVDYEMEFGAGLASCLHQFTGMAGFGVLGAGEDYAHLDLPSGSNPISNPHLSGGYFTVHTEGFDLTRSERVSIIAEHPTIAAKLRVCWEGPQTGRNCGLCEKCIRTKLNFMAVGHDPLCFDRPPTIREILSIKTWNPLQISFLEEIVATADKNGAGGRWLNFLKVAVIKARLRQTLKKAVRRVLPARPGSA